VGCGRIAPKSELLRFAVSNQSDSTRHVVHDRRYSMPGRGAYLCAAADREAPAAECLALAIRRGGIARALRSSVTLDSKLVESVSR
jgi:predicted RNA-binding protein YlxR (DUF448 family)